MQWNGLDAGMAPGFAESVTAALGPLPYVYSAVSGRRTVAQQGALWQQGRDANGNVINVDQVVTNAKGADSPHVWGLAVDVVPIVNGAQLWEPTNHPAWLALFDAVYRSPVLHSGRTFSTIPGGDYDHIERLNWKLFVPVGASPDATGTSGGGRAPTPDDASSGGPPPSDSSGDASGFASDALTWLELDPGVAIGAAALLGVLFLWWLQRVQR